MTIEVNYTHQDLKNLIANDLRSRLRYNEAPPEIKVSLFGEAFYISAKIVIKKDIL